MSSLNRLRDEWNMIHEKRFALVYMHFVSACYASVHILYP